MDSPPAKQVNERRADADGFLALPNAVATSNGVARFAFDVRRNMNVAFILSIPPLGGAVTTSAIAIAGELAKRETAVEIRNIAAKVAKPPLRMKHARRQGREAPMRHATQISTAPENQQSRDNTVSSHCPETQNRTTPASGVGGIRTAKTLVWRHITLVADYRREEKLAHGQGQRWKSGTASSCDSA